MASNVPYSLRSELLDSGSDDEDSDDVSNVATRTRATYTKKKKSRVPRPIEPNVQVQNEQENAGRSGEVSEDRDLGFGDIWSANKVKLAPNFSLGRSVTTLQILLFRRISLSLYMIIHAFLCYLSDANTKHF